MRKQRDAMIVALMLAAIAMAFLAAKAYGRGPRGGSKVSFHSPGGRALAPPPQGEPTHSGEPRGADFHSDYSSPPTAKENSDGAMAGGSPSTREARPVAQLVRRTMTVTAYCPCEKCCGQFADGITASGYPVTANGGRFVAAPREIAFGTLILIPGYPRNGYGAPVPVLDRGAAITTDRLDIYFPTHAEALAWGVRTVDVILFHEARAGETGRTGLAVRPELSRRSE